VFAGGAGQFHADAWIDDAARVHRRAHRRISAGAREIEEPEPFHEKRALLAEEHRKPLVHLDFELIALHLAEVGIHRRIERNR